MSQFYNLEEAAAKLNITTDQLRDLARKKEIRSLHDQGKLRFRAEDVEARLNLVAASEGATQEIDLSFPEPGTPKPSPADEPLSLDFGPAEDFNISLDDLAPPVRVGQPTQMAPASFRPDNPLGGGDLFDSSTFDLSEPKAGASNAGGPSSVALPTDSPFEISEPSIDLGDETGDTAEISQLEAVNPPSKEMTLGDIDLEGTGGDGQTPFSLEGGSSSEGSSDFELSLDEGSDAGQEPPSTDLVPSSSESEFELTMDEDTGVRDESGLDEETSGFDIESNEDSDSGSQIVDVDGSFEQDSLVSTAEFHAGDDNADDSNDDSSSQVVVVEDVEEVDGAGKEEYAATGAPVAYAPAVEAPWGPLPAFLLIPTVIVLFVVSLLSFELMRNMWSYNKGSGFSSIILRPLTELFVELPKN